MVTLAIIIYWIVCLTRQTPEEYMRIRMEVENE